MSTGFTLIVLAEVAVLLFLVWGFKHEHIFVAMEDKIIFSVKQKINERTSKRVIETRRRLNEQVRYTPEKPVHRNASSSKAA